jgi:cobalt/nickel transport protein
VLVTGLVVSVLLAGVLSSYASVNPDGLEYVAETVGFLDSARESSTATSPLAGYGVRGIEDQRLSGGVAGVIGVVVTGVIMAGLVLLLRRFRQRR